MRTVFDDVTVLTMNREREVVDHGYVLVRDGRIEAVGSGQCQVPCDEHIHGRGGILMPGMVNTHCHASMIPFRTMGDDCPDRLRRFLFPLELKAMTPRLVYLAAKFGICEMLLAGTTTFLDMYYFEEEVAKACDETGIRGYLGETVIGQPACDSKEPYGGLKLGEQFIRDWQGHRLVTPIVAPHGTSTNEPDVLKAAHEMARKYDTLYTTHVSEMDYEMAYFEENYHQTPVRFLYEQGLLDGRTIAAHCIHMTDEDLDLMARTGAGVAHCIGSNTKAGKGVARVHDMVERHIPVGLGTDGPSSGNTLSLFAQFRLFASFQKTYYKDRKVFPADEIVGLGTADGAALLLADREIGSVEPGKKADLVLVDLSSAHMFPCFNPYSALVYAADASDVDTVMVDGEVLVRDKRLVKVDLDALRGELTEEMTEFQKAAEEYREII